MTESQSAGEVGHIECTLCGLPIAAVNGAPDREVVYDSTAPVSEEVVALNFETGNEIELAGSSRLMAEILVPYYLGGTPAPGVKARVRLYLNDGIELEGGDRQPGTMIYEGAELPLGRGAGTLRISDLGLSLSKRRMTWTVQFTEAANDRRASLVKAPAKTDGGQSRTWSKRDGQWVLLPDAHRFQAQLAAATELRIIEFLSNTMFGQVRAAGAKAGKVYTLERKSELSPSASWTPVSSWGAQYPGGFIEFGAFAGTTGDSGFFRIAEKEPAPRPE